MRRVYLEGAKVALRPKTEADAVDDYRWRRDPELARLDATFPIQMSFDEFLRLYQSRLLRNDPWSLRFAIITLDGRHIGNCGCYDIDVRKGTAEVGIMIGERAFWGRGYGSQAMATLVEHIFSTTPVRLLYLHTLHWNTRARRSFAKVGFVEKGLVDRGGYTFVRMELPRELWLARRADTLSRLIGSDARAHPEPTP